MAGSVDAMAGSVDDIAGSVDAMAGSVDARRHCRDETRPIRPHPVAMSLPGAAGRPHIGASAPLPWTLLGRTPARVQPGKRIPEVFRWEEGKEFLKRIF
jgi:hypothetical protein